MCVFGKSSAIGISERCFAPIKYKHSKWSWGYFLYFFSLLFHSHSLYFLFQVHLTLLAHLSEEREVWKCAAVCLHGALFILRVIILMHSYNSLSIQSAFHIFANHRITTMCFIQWWYNLWVYACVCVPTFFSHCRNTKRILCITINSA